MRASIPYTSVNIPMQTVQMPKKNSIPTNLGMASVMLSKVDASGSSTTMTQHWRSDVCNEHEMRGIAVKSALELKPGFTVDMVLVQVIQLEVESRSFVTIKHDKHADQPSK